MTSYTTNSTTMASLKRCTTFILFSGSILLNILQLIQAAPLSSYLVSSFTSPESSLPFNNIAVNYVTGDIYIGARERLYQLNQNLTIKQTEIVGPCPHNKVNDNKLLVIAPSTYHKVITCGSCDGYCEMRDISDITQNVVRNEGSNQQKVVITEDVPTVGIIAMGSEFKSDGYGNVNIHHYLFTGRSFAESETYPLSKHGLSDLYAHQYARDYNQNKIRKNDFIKIADVEGYLYYFIQKANMSKSSVHIGRLCRNSLDQKFDSYSEIEIICNTESQYFSVLKAAHIGRAGSILANYVGIDSDSRIVFALFTEEIGTQSAVCLFEMKHIIERFGNTVEGCIKGNTAQGIKNEFISESKCSEYGRVQDTSNFECTAYERTLNDAIYSNPSGVEPLQAEPVVIWSGTDPTSIMTLTERSNTVAVVGDEDGNLMKLLLVNDSASFIYENITTGQFILRDMFYDENTEQIVVSTSSDSGSQVLKLSIANCSQYTTCEDCIGNNGYIDGDPFCGWCTFEASCTRYHECQASNETNKWLPYDATQCVHISDIQPNNYLPHGEDPHQISITVEALPTISEHERFECVFGSKSLPATFSENVIICETPLPQDIPPLPIGADNVTMELSVNYNGGVKFVSEDFYFYDCQRLTTCSTCVTRYWPCDWCVYGTLCTDESTASCQINNDTIVSGENNPTGVERKGQEFCPQLLGLSGDFHRPVDINTDFVLVASNLPTKVDRYDCILHIDGQEQLVSSTSYTSQEITCGIRSYTYKENVLTKTINLSVRWNNVSIIDDINGTQVMLYKCSVNNGSCSRCLSPEVTPTELNCGWCGTDCNVMESGVCTENNFRNQNESYQCPAPKITHLNPRSGPIEGNTILEIRGTDIGVRFRHITSIRVGDVDCDTGGMESHYEPGQSVSCKTGNSSAASFDNVNIVVTHRANESKPGVSDDHFSYRDPSITSFEPTKGPIAGGTRIQISGEYLNAGRNITALFGDATCIPLTINETEAIFITPDTNDETKLPLTMYFDGASRVSQESFDFKPNPTIADVSRLTSMNDLKSIMSGGLIVEVNGNRFDLIQAPKIVATSVSSGKSCSESCNSTDDGSLMICRTPNYPDYNSSRSRRSADPLTANLTFDMDGYEIPHVSQMFYYPDPTYFDIDVNDSNIAEIKDNRILELYGSHLDYASGSEDVNVTVGRNGICNVQYFSHSELKCKLPAKEPAAADGNGHPAIKVRHGSLTFYPGYVRYITAPSVGIPLIGGAVGAFVIVCIAMVSVGILFYQRSQRKLDEQAHKFELIEKKIHQKVGAVFRELQSDMSEIEDELKSLGIPYVSNKEYLKNMLFTGLAIIPEADDMFLNSDFENALEVFSKQLADPLFLVKYIHRLEESQKTHRKNRVHVASLITVALLSEGNISYFTETLFRLLEDEIKKDRDAGSLKTLFRRSDTIVEKLLANWIALCMFGYFKNHASHSLYLLYQSIKIHVENRPIDVITGQSYFTLNFDCLMEEVIEFKEVKLSVIGSGGKSEFDVRVLDVDCITQVKQKILDAAYRKEHFAKQTRAHQMDLIWYHPGGEQRIMRDRDDYNTPVPNSSDVYINTVKSYGIPDGSHVALIEKVLNAKGDGTKYEPVTPGVQLFRTYSEHAGPHNIMKKHYTRIQSQVECGSQMVHLIQDSPSNMDDFECKTELDKACCAPHLMMTKKTIEPRLVAFLDDTFKKPDTTPLTIKLLFDFFDKMAATHCSEKASLYAEAWKSNCLPLQFWLTVLTHPSYVFDMRQSRSADQNMSVLANMLENVCKKIIPEKKKGTPLNRIVFYKELPGYIKMITIYYKHIQGLSTPPREHLEEEYSIIQKEFGEAFNRNRTLKKLFDLTHKDAGNLL